ncbi:hypothetical protein F5883DRAFT_439155 [Diaporthe sp. PMI_573]|jgi:hypothetical protein|nr:hypothetical protein F5883DRAFT_439155 [Diaporthaceae sp. PMI_573]
MDEAWGALIPPHQGFVPVASPASHDLPLQMTDGHGQEMNVFGISAFHQIHCLFMALRSWTAYHYGVEQFTRPDHVLHCFDFLRQEVMCLGDTALEGADEYTIAQGKPGGTLGWGSKHVCNDWDALHQWAVENEARDAGTEKNFPHDYSHVAEAASTCY